jgi:hypothetical protein
MCFSFFLSFAGAVFKEWAQEGNETGDASAWQGTDDEDKPPGESIKVTLMQGHNFSYGMSFMTTISYRGVNYDSTKKAGGTSAVVSKGSASPSVIWNEIFDIPRGEEDSEGKGDHIVFTGSI